MKKVSDFFGKIKKWMDNHKTIVALLVTAAFVLVHIPLILNHEYSNDEGVVWELSKDINLTNIYEVNSVEPHPLLWEIILAPFSQSGLPIITMDYISLVVVALAVFLFVRFAPMGAFSKLIFILSSAFFYFNPVIARDYSLIPLAICLVCLAYKNRHEKPLLYGLSLAFLSQTHFLMYGLLAALIIGYILEESFKKEKGHKMFLSILLVVLPVGLSVLTTVPEMIGSFNGHYLMNEGYYQDDAGNLYKHFIGNYFGLYETVIETVLAFYVAVMFIFFVADNAKITSYLFCGVAFWAFVLANIYRNYHIFNHKAAIISLMILCAAWLIKIEGTKKNLVTKVLDHIEIVKLLRKRIKTPSIVMAGLLVALTIPRVTVTAIADYNHPFTSTNEVAKFVNENVEDGALIIEATTGAVFTFNAPVYAQLEKDITFYNVPINTLEDRQIKIKYDKEERKKINEFEKLSDDELQNLIDESLKRYEHVYVATTLGAGCQGKNPQNIGVLKEYRVIATFNDKEYVEDNRAVVKLIRVR